MIPAIGRSAGAGALAAAPRVTAGAGPAEVVRPLNGDGPVNEAVIEAVIEARRVSKHYQMGDTLVRALDGVSLSIRQGEFVAIMGPSGSGKSTMMNLIGALDRPTSGELRIAGADVAQLSADALAELRNRTLGFVFQQFNLLPRTAAVDQVALPLVYARPRPADALERARRRLEQVGLAERLDHHPRQLSGGQQQRVAIARALVNDPRILLADEPTGALDSKTSLEIMTLFRTLNESGITVVIVTHDAEVAAWAHRRIVFRDGRIVEDTATPQTAGAGVGAGVSP